MSALYKMPWSSSCAKTVNPALRRAAPSQAWELKATRRSQGPQGHHAVPHSVWVFQVSFQIKEFPINWNTPNKSTSKAHLRACMTVPCLYLYAKVFLLLWFLESCDSFLLVLVLSLVQSRDQGAYSSLGFLISTDWPRTMLKALALTLLQPEAGQENIPLLGMMALPVVSHRRAGKGNL